MKIEVKEVSLLKLTDKEGNVIMNIEDNGDIFVKGKLIEKDIEVVDALKEFLIKQGFLGKKL